LVSFGIAWQSAEAEVFVIIYPFWFSAFGGSGLSPAAVGEAASLIKKETTEHRTSNIERPTSNKVFCQLKKRLNKANLPLEIVRINIPRALYHVFSVIRLF